jgi:hypothetical protein
MNKGNSFSNGPDKRVQEINNGPIPVLHGNWCLQGIK